MTAWVWICGSSARDVVWRNVAIVNPLVSGWRRPPSAADAGRRPEPLQVRESGGDGDVVGFEQPVVAGKRPPHRQRLRRRERRIKPRHRPHHPTIGRVPVHQLPPQRCPRHWVTARQQRLQRVDLDPTRQAEPSRLTPRPHTRHLTRCRRQVLGVVPRRRRRGRRVQSRHPQHRHTPHRRPRAGHLSDLACDGSTEGD